MPAPRPFPQPPATSATDPAQRRGDQPLPQVLPAAERWSAVLGASTPVAPLLTDTHVFVVVPPSAVVAYRLEDGVEAWRVDLAAEYPLAVEEGRLFVASGEAIHAIDARTGAVAWRQPSGTLSAPPLVQGGWVVTATEAEVVARRASDGTVVWQRPHGPVKRLPTIEGDRLYLPLADSRLRAVDLTTGEVTWERSFGGAPSEAAALAGRVYVGSADKYFYCLDAENGNREWRHRVGAAVVGRPVIDADRVYFVAMDNMVRALDRVSGALRWQGGLPFRPLGGPLLLGTAVVVPGTAPELRTFDVKTGKAGRPMAFGAPLARPLDVRMSDKGPLAATITGGLTAEWKLTVWEPPTAVPIAPLTVLPGTATPLPTVPPAGGAP